MSVARVARLFAILVLALSGCSGAIDPIDSEPPVTAEPTSATVVAEAPWRLAPHVCDTAAEPGISPTSLPYYPATISLIQGETVEAGDFLFDLWLYCYPTPQSDEERQPNSVKGLEIYGAWYYNGPKVEGLTGDYWGFEPDVKAATQADGPFWKAKGSYRTGISLSQEEITEMVIQGEPLRFQVRIESPVGTHGAVLQFKLTPTGEGYVPTEVSVEPFNEDF